MHLAILYLYYPRQCTLVYHICLAFEFLRLKWLQPPEDGAICTETCCSTNTITIYVIWA